MTSDGGHWPRSGRRRPDRDDYGGEDDHGADPGHNGRGAAYPDADGYGQRAGYDSRDSYDRPGEYGQAGGYGGSERYGSPDGYGDQGSYADPRGYGYQPEYADPNRYRDPNAYGDRNGYGGQADYGEPGGYGAEAGYGGPSGYSRSGGYGGYGEPGYAEPGYDETGYADPGGYSAGSGSRGRHSEGSAAGLPDPASHEPYDGDGYAPDVDTNPYGPASYGSADRYGPGTPGSYDSGGDYGRAGLAGPADVGTGHEPDPPAGYQWRGPYGAADPLAPASYDTGSGGWAFTPGARGYDSDPLGQGSPDSGAFGRPDTGPFGRGDSGSFGRPDFDAEDPAVPARRALPGGGYAEWREDPVDDDWEDDADGGLLSRRFGGGGGREPDDAGGGRTRGRRPRRVRGKAAFTAAILTVALVTGIAAAFGYKYVHTWITHRYGNYSGAGTGKVEITVKQGDTLAGLGPLLLSDGVIEALRPYDTAAAAASGTLQPGVYRLHHHMNSALAVQYLLNPKYRGENNVTIIEGTRASAIAAQLAASTGLKKSDFLKLIDHPPASLGLPRWAKATTAEGFLFPDTYNFLPKETALQILQTMVREFNSKVASINIGPAAAKVFTTPWHILIVASMVQAEAGNVGDMPKISRVVWNRLRIGKPLEFDSTVFYAMNKYGTAINQQEEKFQSPFNTYLHTGLPPAPIGNPGLDALKAALHPIEANKGFYLYFITDTRKKPYKTYFTNSLTQLQQWQRQFQG